MEGIMLNGYLLKLDGKIFPLNLMQPSTYTCTPNQILDEDSYTDGDGVLRRKILPHKRTKIEFNTPPMLESNTTELRNLLKNKDKVTAEYFNTGTGQYASGAFYIPDVEFIICKLYIEKKDILYDSIRIALIEY